MTSGPQNGSPRLVLVRVGGYDESSMDEGGVRAHWPKFIVRTAKQIRDPQGAPVIEAISPDLRREIREAGRLTWQNARMLTDLAEQILQGCGADGAVGFWRESFLECITQPMIAPLARGALTIFGNRPDAFVRRTPLAWQLMTRGWGNFSAVPVGEPNAIILRAEHLPRIFRVDGFICMGQGGLLMEMDYFRMTGAVETRADHLENRGAVDF